MIELLKYEFLVHNKIYNLIKYFLIFFIFCSSSITIVNSYDKITSFGIIFSVISIPLALIGITSSFLKPEIEDGSLELLLTSFNPIKIILTKYLSLFACGTIGFISNLPFSYLFFSIKINQLALIIICGLLLMATSCAITILISTIQCYFRSNTNFLSMLLMPLIIPSIILSGMILESANYGSITLILAGISCIIIPVTVYLSSYLIANIYNI